MTQSLLTHFIVNEITLFNALPHRVVGRKSFNALISFIIYDAGPREIMEPNFKGSFLGNYLPLFYKSQTLSTPNAIQT